MGLKRMWNFFYDMKNRTLHKINVETWVAKQRKVFTFITIEEYWRFMNNVKPIGSLPNGSSFYCFNYIYQKPAWEEVLGGEWRFSINRKNDAKVRDLVTGIFNKLSISCIGDFFTYSKLICGLAVDIRRSYARFAIYNRCMTESQVMQTGLELNSFLAKLKPIGLKHFYHQDLLRSTGADFDKRKSKE